MNPIPIMEKLYQWKDYIVSWRFSPMVLAITVGVVLTKYHWSFEEFKYWIAAYGVIFVVTILWAYPVQSYRRNKQLKSLKAYQKEGEWQKAYETLNALSQQTLLPSEKVSLLLEQAHFYYSLGNHKRFTSILTEVAQLQPEKRGLETRFYYSLLAAFRDEIMGDLSQAISGLESLVSTIKKPEFLLQIYNHLGRLYQIQNQTNLARAEYEKALYLLENHPKPELFNIVIHNLLMNYASNEQIEKVWHLIKLYESMIDKDDISQLLEFSNDVLHAGRQLSDQELVSKSYELDGEIKSLASEEEKLALNVSELRMRFNDGQDFIPHLEQVLNQIKPLSQVSIQQRVIITNNLFQVLRSLIETSQDPRWIDGLKSVIEWNEKSEEQIRGALRNSDSSLFSYRVMLIEFLIRLQKDKFSSCRNDEEFKHNLNTISELHEELIKLCRQVDNSSALMDKLVQAIDECLSLLMQIQRPDLISPYKEQTEAHFEEFISLIEARWEKLPGLADMMVAAAWFSWQLKQDKDSACKWLTRFDNQKTSLEHSAKFIRDWYGSTQQWCNTLK